MQTYLLLTKKGELHVLQMLTNARRETLHSTFQQAWLPPQERPRDTLP